MHTIFDAFNSQLASLDAHEADGSVIEKLEKTIHLLVKHGIDEETLRAAVSSRTPVSYHEELRGRGHDRQRVGIAKLKGAK